MPSGKLAGSRDAAAISSKIDAALAAADREPAVGERYLVRIGLQQVGGQDPSLGDDHLRRLMEGRAAHVHRAGAAMPVAAFHLSRIGLDKAESR